MVEEETCATDKYMNYGNTHQPPSTATNHVPVIVQTATTTASGHPQRPLYSGRRRRRRRRSGSSKPAAGAAAAAAAAVSSREMPRWTFKLHSCTGSRIQQLQQRRQQSECLWIQHRRRISRTTTSISSVICSYLKQSSCMERDCLCSNQVE